MQFSRIMLIMDIKERIIETLAEIGDCLRNVEAEWCIIGASAMILSGIQITETFDIDILTTDRGADEFQHSLREYMEINPVTKEDELFRSNFARFKLPLMNIEAMGNLQVKKDNVWHDVHVNSLHYLQVGDLIVNVPTISEMKRILWLFGRKKDLERIRLLD